MAKTFLEIEAETTCFRIGIDTYHSRRERRVVMERREIAAKPMVLVAASDEELEAFVQSHEVAC